MSARQKAHELLTHYLTSGGIYGDPEEAARGIDALIAAVVELVEARKAVASGLRRELAAVDAARRDSFAAQAMQGLLAGRIDDLDWSSLAPDEVCAKIASRAYEYADAMLAARSAAPRPSVAASPSLPPSPSQEAPA